LRGVPRKRNLISKEYFQDLKTSAQNLIITLQRSTLLLSSYLEKITQNNSGFLKLKVKNITG
jgi:hypothetical protein